MIKSEIDVPLDGSCVTGAASNCFFGFSMYPVISPIVPEYVVGKIAVNMR